MPTSMVSQEEAGRQLNLDSFKISPKTPPAYTKVTEGGILLNIALHSSLMIFLPSFFSQLSFISVYTLSELDAIPKSFTKSRICPLQSNNMALK